MQKGSLSPWVLPNGTPQWYPGNLNPMQVRGLLRLPGYHWEVPRVTTTDPFTISGLMFQTLQDPARFET